MSSARKYELTYLTATILDWKFLLADNRYKDIIVNSLQHMVNENRVHVNAFVIMSNHIHLVWSAIYPETYDAVKKSLLRYTAQTIIKDMRSPKPELLKEYLVNAADRKYQVWERNPLSVTLWTEEVVEQKIGYIHTNPVRSGMCLLPEDYKYCSAAFYLTGKDSFGFLTHYKYG